MIMLGVMFVPVVGIVIASKYGRFLPSERLIAALLYWAPVTVLCVVGASVAISLKIYSRKDI